jgi:hypothetical protein
MAFGAYRAVQRLPHFGGRKGECANRADVRWRPRLVGAWGDVVSANISTHPSGISHYDEAMFLKTIRTGNSSGGGRELNRLMPFSYFRNMTDEDLKSIFAFLQSVKPVKHYLDNSEPSTYCRLRRQNHGFGGKN